MVSTASIVSMAIFGVWCLGIPIVSFIVLKRTGKFPIKSILIGAITFIVFSQVLEKLLNVYIYQINPTTKEWMKNAWLFATFGALMAGLFEEVGRYFSLKVLLRNYHERKDGLAYGLGHGGIESIVIGTLSVVNYLIYSVWINAGTFEQQVGGKLPASTVEGLKHQLLTTPWYSYDLGILDRTFGFLIQLALSLFVLMGIQKGRKGVLGMAILLHALVDFPAGLYQAHKLPLIVTELFVAIVAVIAVWFIKKSKNLFSSHKALNDSIETDM
ncbi:MAG: YhfC family intramembrane metalloprotease [Bacillota bacterium]|nr:YhfC family intramembrane metalloprotease [Bacillota bacterium]